METLTAVSGENGEWTLKCPLHSMKPYRFHTIGGTNNAMLTLKKHMDDKHPGVKARLKIITIHTINTTYTATTNIDTGGLL